MKEMLQVVNERLEERGVSPVRAKDTILNDIAVISNEYYVRIRKSKDEEDARIIRYRYEDTDFSIYDSPLPEKQMREFMFSLGVLARCDGVPGLEWFRHLYRKMDVTMVGHESPAIRFEMALGKDGQRLFKRLFLAIIRKKTIQIADTLPNGKPQMMKIFPYYLTQLSGRWYLLALSLNGERSFHLLDLEEITSFRICHHDNMKPEDIDNLHDCNEDILRKLKNYIK